ncbi:afadin- and alpha-actinin-binding protein [Microcaecilia unicolor]|uniref:Afadin- and alpha-actinin-binding protein-like n=1 Tax=Microcaecilia unicolor TaxID=1415580 RepID=A0A6P7XHW3_9AMPH|nr:afadin- and alpha-actinin-binding protein-like [Microcaecilia unicolor]
MKRKELEVPRLKPLKDKKDRRAEAADTLRPAEARKAAWRFGKAEVKKEEDVVKLHAVLQHLEKQNKELTAENFELKRVQEQMKRDIQQLLSSQREVSLNETEEYLNQTHNITSEQLTHSICKQWRSLKKHLRRLEHQGYPEMGGPHVCSSVAAQSIMGEDGNHVMRVTDHEKEIVMLKQEITASRRLIIMQQQVMQEQLQTAQNSRPLSQPKGCYFLEEQRRLHKDREMLEQQKRVLQVERWNFTEAAIRLGYERKLFEEERALFLKHQFLNTPSLEPRWTFPCAAFVLEHRNLPEPAMWPILSGNNPRVSTPPSAPRNKHLLESSTPSTAELYRVLKLTPQNRTFSVRGTSLCDSRLQSLSRGSGEMENIPPLRGERSQTTSALNRRECACQTQAEDFLQLRSNLLSQFLDCSF